MCLAAGAITDAAAALCRLATQVLETQGPVRSQQEQLSHWQKNRRTLVRRPALPAHELPVDSSMASLCLTASRCSFSGWHRQSLLGLLRLTDPE